MMAVVMITLGLAAVFGFLLGQRIFHRMNISRPLRWLGGTVAGLVLAGVMAVFALLVIWPPFSIIFLGGGLAIVGVVAALTMLGGKEGEQQETKASLFERDTLGQSRGDLNDGLDTFGLDFDTSPGT